MLEIEELNMHQNKAINKKDTIIMLFSLLHHLRQFHAVIKHSYFIIPEIVFPFVAELYFNLLRAGIDAVLVLALVIVSPEAVLEPDLIHSFRSAGVQAQPGSLAAVILPAGRLIPVCRVPREPPAWIVSVLDINGSFHPRQPDLDALRLARNLFKILVYCRLGRLLLRP